MTVTVERVVGADVAGLVPALARLRIAVFAEFPYLYLGTDAYERDYLQTYVRCPDAVVVVARDGERVVGASTALPLTAEPDEVRAPLVAAGLDPAAFLYLGESVLDPAYRGRGLGHAFFDHREAHARALGLPRTCFCAVERPADHPRRPPDYQPLRAFWQRRGYVRHPELATTFSWRDLDEPAETAKPMVFWLHEP